MYICSIKLTFLTYRTPKCNSCVVDRISPPKHSVPKDVFVARDRAARVAFSFCGPTGSWLIEFVCFFCFLFLFWRKRGGRTLKEISWRRYKLQLHNETRAFFSFFHEKIRNSSTYRWKYHSAVTPARTNLPRPITQAERVSCHILLFFF